MKKSPILTLALASLFVTLLTAFTCTTTTTFDTTNAAPVDHSAFDKLLKKYVNDKGLVDYKGFKSDGKCCDQYLDMLSKNPPANPGVKMKKWRTGSMPTMPSRSRLFVNTLSRSKH